MARPVSFTRLDTTHLKCRSWLHAWEHEVTIVEHVGRSTVLVVHLRCLRCGTKRTDEVMRSTGRLNHRSYKDRPKNYLVKGVGNRVTFNNGVRLELTMRMSPKGGKKRGKK